MENFAVPFPVSPASCTCCSANCRAASAPTGPDAGPPSGRSAAARGGLGAAPPPWGVAGAGRWPAGVADEGEEGAAAEEATRYNT